MRTECGNVCGSHLDLQTHFFINPLPKIWELRLLLRTIRNELFLVGFKFEVAPRPVLNGNVHGELEVVLCEVNHL